jgi:hypothetical protein
MVKGLVEFRYDDISKIAELEIIAGALQDIDEEIRKLKTYATSDTHVIFTHIDADSLRAVFKGKYSTVETIMRKLAEEGYTW